MENYESEGVVEETEETGGLTNLIVSARLGLVLVLGTIGCSVQGHYAPRLHTQEQHLQRYQETRHQKPQRHHEYRQPTRRRHALGRDMPIRPYMGQPQRQPMRGMYTRGQYMRGQHTPMAYMRGHQQPQGKKEYQKYHPDKRTR